MKFIDKRAITTVSFRRIKVGECFITSSDNHINMKLYVEDYEDSDTAYNGVDLVTGKKYHFEYDEQVIAVNAEVTAIN